METRVAAPMAIVLHLLLGLGLFAAFWVAHNVYAFNLIFNPVQTLRLLCAIQSPIVILVFSLLRQNPEHCSLWWAIGRGLVGLFVGAILNAFVAVIFGAPIGIQFFAKTMNWSLLMSSFTVVPAASVFGSSGKDWQQLFAYSKPIKCIDYMICLPAHGAIIGAWLGAWPVPLDWERPWQEWPICVTYGAVAGYLFGILASLMFILVAKKRQHFKAE